MPPGDKIADRICDSFVRPVLTQIAEQLNANVTVSFDLVLDGMLLNRTVEIERNSPALTVTGAVRANASETAIGNRYKYECQCILEDAPELLELSGFQARNIVLVGAGGRHEDKGIVFLYNQRTWRKGLDNQTFEQARS